MFRIFKIGVAIICLTWLLGFVIFLVIAKNNQNSEGYIKHSIVLTGGKYRIQEGIRLLDDKLTDIVFISGVNSEVDKQSVLSADFGTHEDDVILGYYATSTKENVIESEGWMLENNIEEVRIITSDYHLFRSKLEFDYSLPNIKKSFHSVNNINDEFLSSLYNWKILIWEFNKFLYVFVTQGVM